MRKSKVVYVHHEIIKKVEFATGRTRKEVTKIVKLVLECLREAVIRDSKVHIRNFGKFTIRNRTGSY